MLKKGLLVFIVMSFCCFKATFSQDIESRIVKEKRAIFVINLIEQVKGFKLSNNNFKIGVLNDDQMLGVFERVAKFRSIKKREVLIKKINRIDEVNTVNAIYVHSNSSSNIDSLLKKVRGKSILLITEYSDSIDNMINITLYQNNFYVEVNSINLVRNGLKPSPSLQQTSLNSIKKLNTLLQHEAKKENNEKKELKVSKDILEEEVEEAYARIETKDNIISKEKDNVFKLQEKNKIKDSELKEKTLTLEGFEKNYELQQKLLNAKTVEIHEKKQEIVNQDKILSDQKSLINKQQGVLTNQKIALDNQNRINLLFAIIGILSLCFMAYIFKVSANRKSLLKRLKEKHREVARKSTALERQNKELEQFAYIASHDLQEPLHTVTSFADFMYEDYADVLDDEGKDNLTYIKNGCDRMGVLIKSLLDYSRIGSERKLEYKDSKEIVNTIIEDFNALITETEAKITFGKMPMILAYSTELRMLFQNIISNAIKFRKPNTIPRVRIEGEKLDGTEEYSHRWMFKIKDNGIGIANEHQKKIFDIFQRLHTRENYEGTGIGLAHCKKVVMFHHGEIWVNSAVGKGTTFNFTIQFNPEQYKELESHKAFS